MTRAVDAMATATCSCGYTITANADRLRCPECKSWITLDHSAPSRQLQLEQRRERVEAKAAITRRYQAWVAFFRLPSEIGLGDTLERLIAAAGTREIGKHLSQLASTCGCRQVDRQNEWNTRYPYEQPSSQN